MPTWTLQSQNTATWTNETKDLNLAKILMENGDLILQEDGSSFILVEGGADHFDLNTKNSATWTFQSES